MMGQSCAECAFWRRGAPAMTDAAAPDDSVSDIGVCELGLPEIFVIDGAPVFIQPVTHASRCCSQWFPVDGDDGSGDDPQPNPSPEPDREKVRRLFPNPPPRPVAA